MDPLTLTAGCLAVTTAIAKTSTSIAEFVRTARGARQDLVVASRQLGELTIALELLRGEGNGEHLPETLRDHIKSVLQNCELILDELNAILANYKGGTGARWTLMGKEEVAGLNKQLEAHLRTLNIAVETSTLVVAQDVKDDTGAIRVDAARILDEIAELRAALPGLPGGLAGPGGGREYMINRYLDSITTYAETMVDSASIYEEEVSPDRPPSSEVATLVPGKGVEPDYNNSRSLSLSPTGIPKTTHERVASSETKELAKQQGSTPPINERIFSHGITRKGEGLVAISRDGAFIAIEEDQKRSGGFFTPDIPGTVTVFETGTAARVHTRKLPKSLKSMSFSPDAKILGLLMRDKLQLLDTWSWKDVAYIDRSDLLSHCFAEDYKQVAISTWSSIYVYRLGGSGVTLDTKFKHRLNDSPTFREVHLACLKKNHVAVSIAGQSTESSYTRIHVRNYDVESGNVTWATSFEEGQPETRKFVDLRAVTAAYEWNGQKTKLRCLDSMGGTVVTTVDPFRVIGRPGPSKDWHTTLLDAVKQKRHHLALFKHFPKHHNPSPWFRIEVVDLQTGYGFFRTDIDLQSYSDTGDARLSHDLKLCLLQLKYAERPKRSGNGNQSSNVVELWRIGSSPVD